MSGASTLLANLKHEALTFHIGPEKLKEILFNNFEEGLLLRPQEISGVLFDFGSLFPGDFQGEEFTTEAASSMGWFFEKLVESIKTLGLKTVISFTKDSQEDALKALFTPNERVIFEKRNLSLSHITRWQKANLLPLGINHLFRIFDELKGINNSKERSESGLSLVSLWGDIDKVGAHWLSNASTFNEIYELNGAGDKRIISVLIDGPYGQLVSWQDVKERAIYEVCPTVRTLHFFGEQQEVNFNKTWNEFFKHDQCLDCLPCVMVRREIESGDTVKLFKGSAAYRCHLPELYQRVSAIKSTLFIQENKS